MEMIITVPMSLVVCTENWVASDNHRKDNARKVLGTYYRSINEFINLI